VLQVANQFLRTWKVSELQKVCRDPTFHRFGSRNELLARIEYLVREREKPDLDYLANAQVDDMLTFLSHALVRMAQLGSPRM
jgi:hypothetical protein